MGWVLKVKDLVVGGGVGGGFLRGVLRFRHSPGGRWIRGFKGGWTFQINPVEDVQLSTR